MLTTAGLSALFLFGAAAAGAVSANDPVASWSFDETLGTTAEDGIGSLDGNINTATRVADGAIGGALRFDGNDRVTVPDNALLRTPQLAFRLWVRGDPESPPASGQVILEKGDANCSGGSYALVVDGGHVVLRYREAAASGQLRTKDIGVAQLPSLWDGEWHQVAFSTKDEEWGSVHLYQQGWSWGTSPGQHAISYTGMTATRLAIGGPAGDGCSTASFTGDIDQVSVYPRVLPRSELATAEPTVSTSIEIEALEPLVVSAYGIPNTVNHADIRISPVPLAPGRLSAWLTAEDGIERGIGAKNIDGPWDVPPDGRIRLALNIEDGGSGQMEFRWEPSLPQLGSDVTRTVSVTKAWSSAHLGLLNTYIEGESIRLGVRVGGIAHVKVNGTAELYERVDDELVLVDTAPLVNILGSFDSAVEFVLPSRAAGSYEFEAKYLGGTAHQPSDAPAQTLAVEPALVTGEVKINGGAEVTDSEHVTVDVPATGAVAIQLATGVDSIVQQIVPRDYEPTTPVQLTNPHQGDDQDGIRTVWVRWADAMSRWTDWSTDTIVLDRGLESGNVTLNGGASNTSSPDVTANVAVSTPSAVSSVQLSNDGQTWVTKPYASNVQWRLAAGEGQRTVRVRWVDALGRQSVGATDSIVVDTGPPSISAVAAKLLAGARPASAVPVRVEWSATDSGAGVRSHDVAVSRNGGAWSTFATGVTQSSVMRSLTPGNSYRFRVRGLDWAGNRSAWRLGQPLRVTGVQEGSSQIVYRGKWTRTTGSIYWNGATKYATGSTASATLTFTGSTIAWIAPVMPTAGSARVFVDGTLAQTVNLSAPSKGSARVVFERSWASSGNHTIRVETMSTARVDIDGFVVLKLITP